MVNELYHHGVKGMRWGVRRYQNDDGTYTKAGRKRYGLDLDLNDKSRQNIARIRLGEARRRLDVSKQNNKTNTTRHAELKVRERSAKRALKEAKGIDAGAKRIAKGETIYRNQLKQLASFAVASGASKMLTNHLNTRLTELAAQGRATAGHYAVAKAINDFGGYGFAALATAYSMKKSNDNANIRRYYNAQVMGSSSIKSIGSTEYSDRVKSSKRSN